MLYSLGFDLNYIDVTLLLRDISNKFTLKLIAVAASLLKISVGQREIESEKNENISHMKFHVQQVLNNYADKDMKPFASTIESLVNSEWFHRHAFALRHRGKQTR